ncbi:MAG: hypothetical protein EKK63_02535 [Acinetobacter sp.]|uniref:hypothetical protein n=1 Tax=Acinetobacter sp. TaxID=472 RepID=UPI000FBE2C25|nr:hypothetical protein [Acinetobacter sp.]RUP42194.1 MAG: hypothetical protein EKK63_02535 [Acinetobacter sp.]
MQTIVIKNGVLKLLLVSEDAIEDEIVKKLDGATINIATDVKLIDKNIPTCLIIEASNSKKPDAAREGV